MELTHKLTYKTGSHTEHHEEYGETYAFEYEAWQGATRYPRNKTYPFVLKSDGQVERLVPPTDGEFYEMNVSKPTNLAKGTYKAIVPQSGDETTRLRLYKIAQYSAGEQAIRIGDYKNEDIIDIDDDAIYILVDIGIDSFTELGCSLIEYSEYDEEIEDYETTVIDEPIGFDSLKVQISRHEYHGIGAESSMDALEFYGNAIDIISNAYATDIDSSIVYEVLAGEEIIYTGKLDLSTFKELRGDYHSISCKVGEIGAKTTFNNRTDIAIDLDDPKTVDGDDVTAPAWVEKHIPKKSLLYTNILELDSDIQNSETLTPGQYYLQFDHFAFSIGEKKTEFGSIQGKYISVESGGIPTELSASFYTEPADFAEKYGQDTQKTLTGNISFNLSGNATSTRAGLLQWAFYIYAKNGSTFTNLASRDGSLTYNESAGTQAFSKDINVTFDGVTAVGSIFYAVIAIYDNGRNFSSVDLNVQIRKGSTIKMTMYDTLPDDDAYTKMIYVHDALDTIIHAISENELSLKSGWYHRPTPRANYFGGGAFKAITNGYKIRGLFTDEETKRNIPLSFKEMIQSLDALDCIGWGFYGENTVAVDRWDTFYRDTILLSLDHVAEVNVDVYSDRIPTELKIGYKKYATQDQYNSIESPHGTRTFVNGIKALSKSITKECEFIADNYAIEETRRARTQVSETEETTYDENIFVFELNRRSEIAHSATNAQNVGRVEEFINAVLTPRHMAARWRDYIFATNNTTPFRFTSGDINYNASFGIDSTKTGLQSMAITDPQVENDNITYTPAKFKAEKITFSYPLTIEQYKTIKADPYGIIRATDAADNIYEGWILDFKYSFQDGMADFTLIAKNNQVNE